MSHTTNYFGNAVITFKLMDFTSNQVTEEWD